MVGATCSEESDQPQMTWIKQNQFLAGFFAVMVLGVGGLGFLLVSAKSKFNEVSTQYEEQSALLNRLQTAKPFPDEANLKKVEAQKKERQVVIGNLQKNVSANQIPLEQITEVQFQDRLRESVNRVVAKANEAGVQLLASGAKFYMGFDPYQTEPPRPEAAPALGRQLKALEW